MSAFIINLCFYLFDRENYLFASVFVVVFEVIVFGFIAGIRGIDIFVAVVGLIVGSGRELIRICSKLIRSFSAFVEEIMLILLRSLFSALILVSLTLKEQFYDLFHSLQYCSLNCFLI